MTTSPDFGLPFIASQQSQPEVSHNQAIAMISAIQKGVISLGDTVPPGSPVDGDTYVLGGAPTGAWLGKANKLAIWLTNAWVFIPGYDSNGSDIPLGPRHYGLRVYVQDIGGPYIWDGGAWVPDTSQQLVASNVLIDPPSNSYAANVQQALDELYAAILIPPDAQYVTYNGDYAANVEQALDILFGGAGGGGIPEAPGDGTFYGRRDAAWVHPVANDVAIDAVGGMYGANVQEALEELDGRVTALEAGGGGGLPDAPSDGTVYARKNAAWVNPGAADISYASDYVATVEQALDLLFAGGGGGSGVPPGGTIGQVLTKLSSADGDADWRTPSAGGGVGAGALTKLAEFTVSVAQATIDFTGLSQSYDDLIVAVTARGTVAAAGINVLAQFNGDTGSNYDIEEIHGYSSGSSFAQSVGNSSMYVGDSAAASAAANRAGTIQFRINAYSKTNFMKHVFAEWGSSNGTGGFTQGAGIVGGTWQNTAAINEIKLLTSSGNFDVGTHVVVYGRGGTTVIDPITPQGRLTLVSGSPVMTSDQTAKTAVYYTPYKGARLPIWNGSIWGNQIFSEMTLTLNSTDNLSGSVYDVFAFVDSGVLQLGTGPAWSSTTARGSGAGTSELERKEGIWTNKVSITLRNNGGSVAGVAANTATYLGSVYCTANGQTGMNVTPAAAGGGTANILGLYNAFNRIGMKALNRDSTASWSYGTTTWRAMNNSNSNRISFLDGLAESPIDARLMVFGGFVGASGANGMSMNSTSASPNTAVQLSSQSGFGFSTTVIDTFAPVLGFNYIQAQEWSSGSQSWNGAQSGGRQTEAMIVQLEM